MISGFPEGNKSSWAWGFLFGTYVTAFSHSSSPGEMMMKHHFQLLKKGCRLRYNYSHAGAVLSAFHLISWASRREKKKKKKERKT